MQKEEKGLNFKKRPAEEEKSAVYSSSTKKDLAVPFANSSHDEDFQDDSSNDASFEIQDFYCGSKILSKEKKLLQTLY